MRRTFVEAYSFLKRAEQEGAETLRAIQNEILKNPEASRVIPGTGGVRKLRVPDSGRGKGKRGGYRVLYLDLPGIERTYLLALYSKGEKDDISAEESRTLRDIAERIKEETP